MMVMMTTMAATLMVIVAVMAVSMLGQANLLARSAYHRLAV